MASDLTPEQQSNTVEVNGFLYATLDFARPDATDKADQRGAIAPPKGWQVAGNKKNVVKLVIQKHPWGTSVLHVSDGTGFGTSMSKHPGQVMTLNNLITENGEVRIRNSTENYHRILICKDSQTPIQSPTLSMNLGKQMLESECFTDCVVSCGSVVMKCHRVVLAMSSPVFKRMFESEMREGIEHRIDIPDADPQIARAMVQFLYTGCLGIESNMLSPMVAIADKYQLEELCMLCATRLVDTIDKDSAFATLKRLRPFEDRESFKPLGKKMRTSILEVFEKDDLLDIIIDKL